MNNSETDQYPLLNIFIPMLHTGTPEYVAKILECNRDTRNGVQYHFEHCKRCQRKLNAKQGAAPSTRR
jgi:hypothetical protein